MEKLNKLSLFSIKSIQMRVFHLTWMTFFVCFFGWFGIAPLMPIIREELGLTKGQIGNIMIASVSITIIARLLFGWLCDKIGPRKSYTWLLVFGSLPVIGIGLSNSYESFLLFRLAIGAIGASFVITQYHTSVMFAPNVVGTANATAAGWGNLGGGVVQMVMPLIFSAFVGLGYVNADAWRYSMMVPGFALLIMGVIYFFFTQDTPDGNLDELRKTNPEYRAKAKEAKGSFSKALKDYRVWVLALAYAACFGIEITIDNVAVIYFTDNFKLGLKEAGLIAGLFGLMNIFARALGGIASDKVNKYYGLKGRVWVLVAFLAFEGLGILLFSTSEHLGGAVSLMLGFALFVKMSNGATYSIVPFVNKDAIGSISGIVGAGGNIGAVCFGFLFKSESLTYRDAFFIIGVVVCCIAVVAALLKFNEMKEVKMKEETEEIAEEQAVLA